jgi:hypothetical protein
MQTKQKQNVVAVSESCKAFFAECGELYGAAGKTKDYVKASEREIGDAMVEFIAANRNQTRAVMDDEGNPTFDDDGKPVTVAFDAFELEVKRTLALRATTERVSSVKAENAKLAQQLADLRAELAALTGGTGAGDNPPA